MNFGQDCEYFCLNTVVPVGKRLHYPNHQSPAGGAREVTPDDWLNASLLHYRNGQGDSFLHVNTKIIELMILTILIWDLRGGLQCKVQSRQVQENYPPPLVWQV